MIHDLPKSLVEDSKKILKNSKEYEDFFQAKLKKFGVTSPAELDGEKKKEFFDYIDKNWKGDSEKKEEVKEGELPPALKKAIDKKKEDEDDSDEDESDDDDDEDEDDEDEDEDKDED